MPFTGLDLGRGHNLWTEQEQDLYERLPIYLAKTQVEHIKLYDKWGKLLKPMKWTPNQGHLLRGVRKEPSPVLRAQALPNTIQQLPTKDVIAVRETTEDAQLYRKDFDSNVFQFLPNFADFLTNHVEFTQSDMMEKIMVYKDLFYRTAIFHGSPQVWVCGKTTELTDAGHWTSPNIALSKGAAELQNLIADATEMLTLRHLKKLGVVMYTDIGATPFSGGVLPDGTDGKGLTQKYALCCGTEVWDSFTDDGSYALDHRKLDMDVVTGPFTGSLFGRWTTMHERYELRIAADGTTPAPETLQITGYNAGESVPNPAYVNAPFGVAFAIGAEAYKSISVGPPPNLFSKGNLDMQTFNGMNWNGKVHITRNLLVPSLDENGAVVNDTNKRGEYLQLIADLVMGIMPIRRRNIVPIIYKRERIATS